MKFFVSAKGADIAFVLDSSGSVRISDSRGWQRIRAFVRKVVESLDISRTGYRVAIVLFSTNVRVAFHLNRHFNKGNMLWAIDNLPYDGGNTNTPEALRWLYKNVFIASRGDRADAANIAILITDGLPNRFDESEGHILPLISKTGQEASKARKLGIEIFAIGVGLLQNQKLVYRKYARVVMRLIASEPYGRHIIYIDNFAGFSSYVFHYTVGSIRFSATFSGSSGSGKRKNKILHYWRKFKKKASTNNLQVSVRLSPVHACMTGNVCFMFLSHLCFWIFCVINNPSSTHVSRVQPDVR